MVVRADVLDNNSKAAHTLPAQNKHSKRLEYTRSKLVFWINSMQDGRTGFKSPRRR